MVIIPYRNWKTIPETSKNPIVWAESGSNSPADEIGAFPVAYGKAMQRSAFSNEYYTELVYSHVDAVNLLYVALTRAADELYIFLPEKTDRRTASSESITAVVPLVVAALPEVEGMTASADGMVFTAGQALAGARRHRKGRDGGDASDRIPHFAAASVDQPPQRALLRAG